MQEARMFSLHVHTHTHTRLSECIIFKVAATAEDTIAFYCVNSHEGNWQVYFLHFS